MVSIAEKTGEGDECGVRNMSSALRARRMTLSPFNSFSSLRSRRLRGEIIRAGAFPKARHFIIKDRSCKRSWQDSKVTDLGPEEALDHCAGGCQNLVAGASAAGSAPAEESREVGRSAAAGI